MSELAYFGLVPYGDPANSLAVAVEVADLDVEFPIVVVWHTPTGSKAVHYTLAEARELAEYFRAAAAAPDLVGDGGSSIGFAGHLVAAVQLVTGAEANR